jgi:uncharacterized membrane protein YedE/YeeE
VSAVGAGRFGGMTLRLVLVGVFLGVVFTKAEVISWFRIQEMFRFQSFHMYGIIGSAVAVGALSLLVIKKLGIRTLDGAPIEVEAKKSSGANYRYWMGGALFGLGWGLLGACPGPIYALIGNGITVLLASLAAALVGTWSYGWLKPHLPHH